jgi:hypothetical protein
VSRFVQPGRTPADERLDDWVESGRQLPAEAVSASWT